MRGDAMTAKNPGISESRPVSRKNHSAPRVQAFDGPEGLIPPHRTGERSWWRLTKADYPAPYWQHEHDEVLEAAIGEALQLLSDERHQQVAPLDSWQKEFLSRPLSVQHALIGASTEEVETLMRSNGYTSAIDRLGGPKGLARRLDESRQRMLDA